MTGTVLVIDDSQMMRRLIGQALTGAGFSVVEAPDGLEALDRVRDTPDMQLIVCDINMPNMNGIEFLEAVRKTPYESKLPVVMLTTRGQLEYVAQARALGANHWLFKPFNPVQLVEVARELAGPGA